MPGVCTERGNWKYCYYLNGEEELYNLEKDPNETVNLISEIGNEEFVAAFRENTIAFWKPDGYLARLQAISYYV